MSWVSTGAVKRTTPLLAIAVTEIIAETPGLFTVVHHSEEEFVLDIWERR